MDVTPENSTCSRSPSPSRNVARAPTTDEEHDDQAVASRRPMRMRPAVNYTGSRRLKRDAEEDSKKPAAAPVQNGKRKFSKTLKALGDFNKPATKQAAVASARENLEEVINLADSDNEDGPIAARRPRRTQKSISYADEPEKTVRAARKRDEDDEDDRKPPSYPIGTNIRRKFDTGFFEGEVVAGPSRVNGELVWTVVYEDGDKEEMNLNEIKDCEIMDTSQQTNDTTHHKVTPTRKYARRGGDKAAENPYTLYKADYETALTDLKWRIGTTEEEAKAALDQMTAPYGLNEAMQLIHKAKEDPDYYVPREKFKPHKGMRIRKSYDRIRAHNRLK